MRSLAVAVVRMHIQSFSRTYPLSVDGDIRLSSLIVSKQPEAASYETILNTASPGP
jgi:hypothetical protein